MQGERSDREMSQGHANGQESLEISPTSALRYARLLGQVDLFAGVERVALAKLAAHLERRSYRSREIIFRQADPGDAFYLIAGGSVGVYLAEKSGAGEIRVKVLQAGEPFGEMALLTNNPRTTTIIAETDCEVLRLDRSFFLDLVREQPSVALAIAATLSRRLAGMLDQPSGSSAPAAAMPEQAGGAPEAVAARPAAALRWRPGYRGLALAAAVGILAAGWALPPPLGLSAVAWHALVVLLAILPALALDAMLEGVLALLLAGAWVVLGVAAPAVALAGFATPNWILVVAVLIIGAAITETGILYRLALAAITHMRGGFPGEVTALSLAGLLISPAVPHATSRVIMVAPMLTEVTEALGHRARSRPAAGLAMAALVGFGQMTAVFLTSSTTGVLVWAVLPAEAQKDVNWITWAYYGAPANIILFVGLLGSILWLYRPAAGDQRSLGERAPSLALQRALLGPMSRDEKIALGVGSGLLLGFMTQPLHHVDPAWVAVLATGVLTAARVVTVNTLRAVNWNFALLFGVLISLAIVFERTGIDRWMAGQAAAAGDLSAAPVVLVVRLAAALFCDRLLVRWQAAAPLITIALAPVASAAGVHPFLVGLIAMLAGNSFWLRYQSTSLSCPLCRYRWRAVHACADAAGGARLRFLDHCRRSAQRAGVAVDGAAVKCSKERPSRYRRR